MLRRTQPILVAIMFVMATTERLRLRRLTRDDRSFVAAMLEDPDVTRFYPHSITDAGPDIWIEHQLQRYGRDGHGLWLVESLADGQPIGQAGVTLQNTDRGREPEVGYLIHRPFWGCGYATEAGRACVSWAFRALSVSRVVSLILPRNIPSIAVARKLGMQRAGVCEHAGAPHLVFARARDPGERSP